MVMAVGGRQPVTSSGMIRKLLSSHRYGDRVPLTVLRQGELIELHLPVEEVPGLEGLGLGDDEESPLREDDDD